MQNNNDDKKKKKKEKKQTTGQVVLKSLKIFLIVFLMLSVVVGGILIGVVLSILKEVPEIDPSNVTASLDQTSTIVDANGELIEKIQTLEFRTIVKLNQIPKHLHNFAATFRLS